MGLPRATVVMQQNENTRAGVEFDTNVIGTASGKTLESGINAPVYIIAGTQTASLTSIILSTDHAGAGDRFLVRKYTTAVLGTGASEIALVNGAIGGAIVGRFQVGTATPNEAIAVFDGNAARWR